MRRNTCLLRRVAWRISRDLVVNIFSETQKTLPLFRPARDAIACSSGASRIFRGALDSLPYLGSCEPRLAAHASLPLAVRRRPAEAFRSRPATLSPASLDTAGHRPGCVSVALFLTDPNDRTPHPGSIAARGPLPPRESSLRGRLPVHFLEPRIDPDLRPLPTSRSPVHGRRDLRGVNREGRPGSNLNREPSPLKCGAPSRKNAFRVGESGW